MSDRSRRRLLAATGTVCTGAVAGCTGSGDKTDGTDGLVPTDEADVLEGRPQHRTKAGLAPGVCHRL
ncbi:hypothetical protein [Natrinema limicola]|uniref:Uncharacterized protein n=1 Tax=Natrinema limicola JCM 13563 TaxID=1230457 RepID=M0C921_9EURY|nr:hypothetical protein [Natrinema limicola]ELZ19108.1 hypothetical protein C476_12933 [Natrinema limicola JCM 13563]